MESMSVFHWPIAIVFAAIVLIPTARILKRAGFSRWWCIVAVIPFLNLVGLWLFAFVRWPIGQEE